MNYQKIYQQIIDKFLIDKPTGYCEIHHIVPRCLGGSNKKDNLIKLPARYHLIAHLLLAKIHGGKLINAAWMMTNMRRYNSRKYEWLKIKFAEKQAAFLSINHIAKGKKRTPEQRKRQSDNLKNKFNTQPKKPPIPHKGKKLSEETKQKIREANLGKKQKPETIEKRRKHLLGNKFAKDHHSLEHIENLRVRNKGNKYNLGRKQSAEIVAKRMTAIKAAKELRKAQ